MTDTEKDSILITRFLDLDLSDEELVAFEERLSQDIEFEREFQTYLAAQTIVNDSFSTPKEQLQTQQWSKIIDKKKSIQTSNKISWKWIGSIAAGLILLMSIWQLNFAVRKPNMSTLLSKAWNKEIGLNYKSLRSLDKDSIKTLVHNGFEAYQNKNYQLVIDVLNNCDNNNSDHYFEDVLLLRALSNFKIGDTEIALKILDTLANYPTGKNSKIALWYKGLIHLEKGDTDAAKEFLLLPSEKFQEIQLKE